MTNLSLRASVFVVAVAVLAACGGDKSKADGGLATDSTLNRDLQLAGTDTAAKPQLTDVPKAPLPATKTKTKAPTKAPATKTAPAPAAPAAPKMGTIASGTQLSLKTGSDLCTNTNKVGDSYTATLSEAVNGSNGAVIPAGATVTFTVSKLKRSENTNDAIEMVFTPTSIEVGSKSYALDASVNAGFAVDKVRNQPKGSDAKKVVGGAAVGAIAGQLLGKNAKSTVIGAAVGAAAGGAAAVATANYEGCVRTGTTIVVTLTSALQVTVS
jgi:hypothetical protein